MHLFKFGLVPSYCKNMYGRDIRRLDQPLLSRSPRSLLINFLIINANALLNMNRTPLCKIYPFMGGTNVSNTPICFGDRLKIESLSLTPCIKFPYSFSEGSEASLTSWSGSLTCISGDDIV